MGKRNLSFKIRYGSGFDSFGSVSNPFLKEPYFYSLGKAWQHRRGLIIIWIHVFVKASVRIVIWTMQQSGSVVSLFNIYIKNTEQSSKKPLTHQWNRPEREGNYCGLCYLWRVWLFLFLAVIWETINVASYFFFKLI